MIMEQHALKNVNICSNTNIYTNLETFDGQETEIEDVRGENQIFYKKCGILILDVLIIRL